MESYAAYLSVTAAVHVIAWEIIGHQQCSDGPKATVPKLKRIQNLSPDFVDLPQTPFAFYGGCHKGGP